MSLNSCATVASKKGLSTPVVRLPSPSVSGNMSTRRCVPATTGLASTTAAMRALNSDCEKKTFCSARPTPDRLILPTSLASGAVIVSRSFSVPVVVGVNWIWSPATEKLVPVPTAMFCGLAAGSP